MTSDSDSDSNNVNIYNLQVEELRKYAKSQGFKKVSKLSKTEIYKLFENRDKTKYSTITNEELANIIDAKNEVINKRDKDIENMFAIIQEQKAELDAKNKELDAKNKELDAKNKELDAKNKELENLIINTKNTTINDKTVNKLNYIIKRKNKNYKSSEYIKNKRAENIKFIEKQFENSVGNSTPLDCSIALINLNIDVNYDYKMNKENDEGYDSDIAYSSCNSNYSDE
jgi:hypothetical protein